MVKTGQEVPTCAYPGCENEPRPGETGAEPGYCGLPDPVTGEPHTALTAFRQRQMLARQGGGVAGPEDLGRPGFAFWRRRQRPEADAREARLAALEADARLAEALAATAAAEQEAAAAREAGQARAAQAERAAQEQVAAVRQERDDAISGAESQAAEARSRADDAEQDAAESARAEHAEADLQRAGLDRDKAAGQAARQQPKGTTRRSRRPRKK